MIEIDNFINGFSAKFDSATSSPWNFITDIQNKINQLISTLSGDFIIENNIAIHRSANIETGVVLKGPIIISEKCFIGAHAYLRGGVFLGNSVSIGPGCEVKSTAIFDNSALAHFNFIGDSLIGSNVNFEAGAVIANHYNERKDKTIFVPIDGTIHSITSTKFGALIGDNTKVGANAVLSPGTILKPNSIVNRLELIDQIKRS